MNELEWLTSNDPQAMIRHLHINKWKPSNRKLRLFACACARHVWHLLKDEAPCGSCNECIGGTPGKCCHKVRSLCFLCKGKGRVRQDDEDHEGTPRFNTIVCPDCKGDGHINRSRKAVEIAERYAEGQATSDELNSGLHIALQAQENVWNKGDNDKAEWGASLFAVMCCNGQDSLQGYDRSNYRHMSNAILPITQANVVREIFGNPWCPMLVLCPLCRGRGIARYAEYEDKRFYFRADAAIPRPIIIKEKECITCKSKGKVPGVPKEWLTWNYGKIPKMVKVIYDECRFEDLPIMADALEDAGCINSNPILEHLRSPGPHFRGCYVLDTLLGKE